MRLIVVRHLLGDIIVNRGVAGYVEESALSEIYIDVQYMNSRSSFGQLPLQTIIGYSNAVLALAGFPNLLTSAMATLLVDGTH
jgi:hypothetical protein